MKKSLYRLVWWCMVWLMTGAVFFNQAQAQSQAQTGLGSATADNATVHVMSGTTELRFSETSYFGPNSHWQIDGTLEIWSKRIWIAPGATFSGTGKIIIHNPGDNPYYEEMADSPTLIDGNNSAYIGVTIELRNPHNLVLDNFEDPGYGATLSEGDAKSAALNIGNRFVFAVDGGDVLLNGHDFGMSQTAALEQYSSHRMIVTGNSIRGHVIKEYANSSPIVFPVGIAEGDYTPATVAPMTATSIYVSVQDYGAASSTISDEEKGMDRIWHIYADEGVQATYTLQHNRITNGLAYVDNQAQIVQYAGSGNWIGDATTLAGEGIHTRADILTVAGVDAAESWFTKLAEEDAIAPTPGADFAAGTSCEVLHINVLENDQPGSSALLVNSVRIVQAPGFGTVEINADGSISYTPRPGFVGRDQFKYEVSNEEGLSGTAIVSVDISECPLKIPNVFTPNGDGINDYFEIEGLEQFDRVEVLIFNRWGNEVYRHDNYDNSWQGIDLNEGTYYYRIVTHQRGEQNRYESWVLLKRN